VPPDAADAGTLIDEGVRDLFTGRTGSASLIGNALMAAVNDFLDGMLGSPHRETVMGSVLYGYWLREFAERSARDVPPFPLPLGLPLTPDGGIDYGRWSDDDEALRQARIALVDTVWDYGGTDDAFEWMGADVTDVVFALAAWWIHASASPRGRAAKRMNVEAIAACIRAGYAVRGFELVVREPLRPFGSYLNADESPMETSYTVLVFEVLDGPPLAPNEPTPIIREIGVTVTASTPDAVEGLARAAAIEAWPTVHSGEIPAMFGTRVLDRHALR
jgi:hypothetical protein